jgi:REP element-mobilizing transposase RayT
MALHSHVKIYVHLIWGTHKHQRIINSKLKLALFNHLSARAKESNIILENLNIQPEHIHSLLLLPSDKSIAQIAKQFKGESSNWINDNNLTAGKFRWQRGYGAFSVSASQLKKVNQYIKNQDEHHKRKSFAEEYEEWARQYGILKD